MENYNQGSTVAPSQTPIVAIELQRLEKQMEELAQVSVALESRLAVAMREPEPTKENNDALSQSAQSELAAKVHQRVLEAKITSQLSSIMRRLDI